MNRLLMGAENNKNADYKQEFTIKDQNIHKYDFYKILDIMYNEIKFESSHFLIEEFNL